MLTQKQLNLLKFIDQYTASKGISPSFEEMKKAVRLQSKSGIHRLISALVERGYLLRLPHKARALEVLKLPPNIESKSAKKPSKIGAMIGDAIDLIKLPVLGKIAAGTPIEAIRDNGSTIDVPGSFLARGEHYALRVDGDSMIEAGINDGDYVLIKRSDTADNGKIVVALVDDNEATLKTLWRKAGKIELEPANANYKTQTYTSDRVKVQGMLVGLIRKYY
jgi:repressor LexA